MEKELKRLAETTLKVWHIARGLAIKNAGSILLGDAAKYLVGGLLNTEEMFDVAYVGADEVEQTQYKTLIIGDDALGRQKNDSAKSLYIKGNDKTDVILSGAHDKSVYTEVKQYATGLLTLKDSSVSETVKNVIKHDEAYIISEMTETLMPLVSNGIAANVISKSDGEYNSFFSYRTEAVNDVGDYIHQEYNYDNTSRNAERNISISNTRKMFNLPLEYYHTDGTKRSEHSGTNNSDIDIRCIEEALAKQIHEQLSSGFPMYVG